MKNKGFTLIELLAVILILGIIALIAIPTINNIIFEAKLGSNNVTAKNVVETVEKECELARISGKSITGTYSIDQIKDKLKGKVDATGTYSVDDDCNVLLSIVYNEFKNYCYAKTAEGDVTYYEMDDNITCLPALTAPTSDSCFTYTETNDEITITGYNCGGSIISASRNFVDDPTIDSYTEGTNMDVIIPNYINGKPVTRIADGAFVAGDILAMEIDPNKKTIIHSLVIPKNVKEIGIYAFSLNKINKLVLSEGIETIGAFAFARSGITGEIMIPNSVVTINEASFYGNEISGTLRLPSSVTTIGASAFVKNKITGNLVIPPSVASIGFNAFGINDINSIDLKGPVELAQSAFYSWHGDVASNISNINLRKIINRTGTEIDWGSVISGWEEPDENVTFESGDYTITNLTYGSYVINITTE